MATFLSDAFWWSSNIYCSSIGQFCPHFQNPLQIILFQFFRASQPITDRIMYDMSITEEALQDAKLISDSLKPLANSYVVKKSLEEFREYERKFIQITRKNPQNAYNHLLLQHSEIHKYVLRL